MGQSIPIPEDIPSGLTAIPSVSAIIPVYNRAHLIKAAIESVLGQTVRPCEIIVVDDGSTDETEAIVQTMESLIPIIYHRQQNQGPAKARNVGVKLAKGDWIAFLDSDDEWLPAKVELQLQAAHERSNTPFIYSEVLCIGRAGEPLRKRRSIDPLGRLYFQYPPYPSTVLLRRDVFNEMGGFIPELHYGEDIELFSRIAAKHAIWFLRRPLVNYRVHELQITSQSEERTKSLPILIDSFMDLVRNYPDKRAIVRTHACGVYSDFGKVLMLDGQWAKARQHFLKAFGYRWSNWRNLRRLALSCIPSMARFYITCKKRQSDDISGVVLPGVSAAFISCPACGLFRTKFPIAERRLEQSPVFQGSYLVHRCRVCGTEFAWPRLPAPPEWYAAKHEHYGWRWEFDILLTDLAQDQKSRPSDCTRKILEVGCGEGILLERLASEGEAWGIEPNTAAAVIAMSKGLRVYAQEFSMFRVTYPDARFDVIAFFQVLEHVPHPWEFLSQIKTLLSRSGFIVFSVPNPDRYTVFFEREWWDYPPHHLTRFSKRGLSLLLERAGFEIVCSIDKPTDESDVALAWKFLYKKVPIPRRARQALKWPLRLALKPIAKMCVDRATGQDLYVVARPRMQELGNEGREPPCD